MVLQISNRHIQAVTNNLKVYNFRLLVVKLTAKAIDARLS